MYLCLFWLLASLASGQQSRVSTRWFVDRSLLQVSFTGVVCRSLLAYAHRFCMSLLICVCRLRHVCRQDKQLDLHQNDIFFCFVGLFWRMHIVFVCLFWCVCVGCDIFVVRTSSYTYITKMMCLIARRCMAVHGQRWVSFVGLFWRFGRFSRSSFKVLLRIWSLWTQFVER